MPRGLRVRCPAVFRVRQVAALLTWHTKGLIIGEAASDEPTRGVEAFAKSNVNVDGINELRRMHLGPDDVWLALSADFKSSAEAEAIARAVTEIEGEIKTRWSSVRRVFLEIQSASGDAAIAARSTVTGRGAH